MKLKLMGMALNALIFSACGSSNSNGSGNENSDPLNNKNYIFILTEVTAGICESDTYRLGLSELGLQDFITRETVGTTSCETYGKRNDNNECAMELIGDGSLNCVVGFNDIPAGFDGLNRQVGPVNLNDSMVLIKYSFQ